MKLIGFIIAGLLFYGFIHLGEILSVYADQKATVWQQISLRINLGFITLSLILCICTLAIIDAIGRINNLAVAPAVDTAPEEPTAAPTALKPLTEEEVREQDRAQVLSSVKSPLARRLLS